MVRALLVRAYARLERSACKDSNNNQPAVAKGMSPFCFFAGSAFWSSYLLVLLFSFSLSRMMVTVAGRLRGARGRGRGLRNQFRSEVSAAASVCDQDAVAEVVCTARLPQPIAGGGRGLWTLKFQRPKFWYGLVWALDSCETSFTYLICAFHSSHSLH